MGKIDSTILQQSLTQNLLALQQNLMMFLHIEQSCGLIFRTIENEKKAIYFAVEYVFTQ